MDTPSGTSYVSLVAGTSEVSTFSSTGDFGALPANRDPVKARTHLALGIEAAGQLEEFLRRLFVARLFQSACQRILGTADRLGRALRFDRC